MSILLLCLPFLAFSSCLTYKCTTFTNNTCILLQGSTVYVSQCPSGYYCSQVPLPATSLCKPQSGLLNYAWPGEPCRSNPCAFGYCNGTVCVGKAANEDCEVSDDCGPGLFCKSGTCESLIPYHFGPCSSDYDCASSAGCDNGVCIEYFSKYEAQPVECIGNLSNICRSGSCYEGYCLRDLTGDKGEGNACSSNLNCYSSVYSMPVYPFDFFSDCQCAPNGKQYCSLFPGDLATIDYRNSLIDWINSDLMQQCNTMRRFSQGCISSKWDSQSYANLMYRMILAVNYTQVKFSQSCVTSVLYPEYTSFNPESSGDSSTVPLFSLVLISYIIL